MADPITYNLIRNTVEGTSDPLDEAADVLKGFNRLYTPNYQQSGQAESRSGIMRPMEFAQQALTMGEMFAGKSEPLSTEESKRMTELEAKTLRNKAIEYSGGSGSFNPRNRFSLDTRGASSAVNRAVTDATNNVREKRIAEIAPEYQELAGQDQRYKQSVKATNEFAQEATSDYMKDYHGSQFDIKKDRINNAHDLTKQGAKFGHEDASQSREFNHDTQQLRLGSSFDQQLEELRQGGRIDLKALDGQNAKELANVKHGLEQDMIKWENEGAGGTGTPGGSKQFTPATISNRISQAGSNLLSRAEKLEDLVNDDAMLQNLDYERVPDPENPDQMITKKEAYQKEIEQLRTVGYGLLESSINAVRSTTSPEVMEEVQGWMDQIPGSGETTDIGNIFEE